MNALIPFESQQLPAHLQQAAGAVINTDLSSNVGVAFPILSIKGKVFTLVENGIRAMLTKPDSDEPLSSLEAVLVKGNPNLSKVYYASSYVEGSDAKPDCWSNDGKTPDSSVDIPQSASCLTCKQNVWGAKITEAGTKAKACADSRKMAIAATDGLHKPMMLRVPAASLKPLAQFADELKRRNVEYTAVVTKIGFDYTVAHPQLTFKPVGFLGAEEYARVMEMRDSEIVQQIIGAQEHVVLEAATATPAPAPIPAQPATPTAAAAAVAVKQATKRNTVKKDVAPAPVAAAPAPTPAAAAPAPVVATVPSDTSKALSDVDDILSGLGIDD